jgi:hypothetical protein
MLADQLPREREGGAGVQVEKGHRTIRAAVGVEPVEQQAGTSQAPGQCYRCRS